MMEDPFIENNNGLSDMSADDGGLSDLDETEDEESVGSDAFITPLVQYKPHDDHLGLRRRRRTNNLPSMSDLTSLKSLGLTQCQIPKSSESLLILARLLESLKFLNIDKNKFKNGSKTEEVFTSISSDLHLTKKEEPQLLEMPYDDHISYFHLTQPLLMKFDLISKFLNYVSLGGPMIDQIYHSILKKPVALLLSKPFDDHFGVRQRRMRRIKLSTCGGTLDLISWFRDDDYLLHRLIDLAKGVDVVSQMISPPAVTAAAGTDCNLNLATASVVTARPRHTEQRITPSSLLLNTPLLIDIPEGNSNDEELHGRRRGWSQKMDFEWIFVITNTVLEFMSAIFTQLSSKQKPQYALFGMLLSYLALLTCIIELIYKDRHHQQIPVWRRRRGTCYYDRPQRNKFFATLNNVVALACALGQCVVTTINYKFGNLIKVNVLSIILAFGVLFSKIFKYRERSST